MLKKVSAWLPVILWMGVIFFFSSMPDLPNNKIDILDFIFKKSAHMVEFALLFAWVLRATKGNISWFNFSLPIFWAFLDETHQLFVPGRGGHLTDVLIDSSGIILAYYLLLNWKKWPFTKLVQPKKLKS